MQNKYFKRIAALLLAAVVAIGTFTAGAVNVNAASKDWHIGIGDPAWTGTDWYLSVYNINTGSEGTIISAKSSNTNIFKIRKETYEMDGKKITNFFLKGKKAGKAKLTVTFKTKSGTKKTISQTVRVKKYPNEIKSLKVDGKTVNTKENKFFYSKKISKSKASIKIKMALKDGWKIDSVSAQRAKKDGVYKDFTVKKSQLKKGTAIKLSTKYKEFSINVQLRKGDDHIHYTFIFYR